MVSGSSIRSELSIRRSSNALILRNSSKKSISITVRLAGSKAFSIPERHSTVKIKPNGYARIPFRFQERDLGWPMALSARRSAAIQLWGEDPKSKKPLLIESVLVSARAPLFLPELSCMASRDPRPRRRRGNSPPSISMRGVKPGTDIPKNTGTVEISWEISGADEIRDYISNPGAEVLEPGTFTDASGWECSCHETPESTSYTYTPGPTMIQTLWAKNADGEVYEHETVYAKADVGYHRACCPAGGTVHTDEIVAIREMLEDIDGRLRSNALEDLPGFIEDWNRIIEERIGRGELPERARDYILPAFDDLGYLSGGVGRGSLADDLLAAMQGALIYIKSYTLPRGWRPGTLRPGQHHICEEYECNGHTCLCMGNTAYYPADPDCNWVGICLERGADGLTLLHELYHYTTGRGGTDEYEARAVAVSCCCFDFLAPEYW